eukprot:3940848-Rhodomonas_salina.4
MQETASSVHFVPGMRFLVFEFAAHLIAWKSSWGETWPLNAEGFQIFLVPACAHVSNSYAHASTSCAHASTSYSAAICTRQYQLQLQRSYTHTARERRDRRGRVPEELAEALHEEVLAASVVGGQEEVVAQVRDASERLAAHALSAQTKRRMHGGEAEQGLAAPTVPGMNSVPSMPREYFTSMSSFDTYSGL